MCECIERLNEKLIENNTKITVPITLNFTDGTFGPIRVLIVTEKLDSRKRARPVKLFGAYCPFCGERYE